MKSAAATFVASYHTGRVCAIHPVADHLARTISNVGGSDD